jgi:hypothetical protein
MLLVDSGTPELILQILKVHLLIWKEAIDLFERADSSLFLNRNAARRLWHSRAYFADFESPLAHLERSIWPFQEG